MTWCARAVRAVVIGVFIVATQSRAAADPVAADSAWPGAHAGVYMNNPLRGVPGATADGETAVAFDAAVGQHVLIDAAATPIGSFGALLEAFTVEFWLQTTATDPGAAVLGTANDGTATRLVIDSDGSRFRLLVRSETGRELSLTMSPGASARLRDGTFHHVAWVVESASAGTAALYVDGTEDVQAVRSGDASGGFASWQYDFVLAGVDVGGTVQQHLDATLDEVALYPRALSPARLRERVAAGIGGVIPEAVTAEPIPALDHSGRANHGVYEGGPLLGRAGATVDGHTAVRFEGSNDVVRIPTGTTGIDTFGDSLESLSVEYWYKSTAANAGAVIFGTVNSGTEVACLVQVDESSGFNLLLRSQAGNPPMFVRMSPAASAQLRDGQYHHVVWVVTSAAQGAAAVYVDGNEDTGAVVEETAAGPFAPFDFDPVIGAGNERGNIKQWVDATLDEVALYGHALAPGRIQAHYLAAGGSLGPTMLIIR